MSLEIHKTLIISTVHIEESDLDVIANDLISYELGEYGWLIWVNPVHVNNSLVKDVTSNALRAAIKLAQDNDCLYLRLDRDGPEVDELPKFNW